MPGTSLPAAESEVAPPPGRTGATLLAADTLEDYAAAVGVSLRQLPAVPFVPFLRPAASRLPRLEEPVESLHDRLLAGGLGPREDWIGLQRLWHRWHAPRDFVPPMRWYLTAAWPERGPLGSLAEAVDACLQEIELAAPAARPAMVAEALRLASPRGALLAHGDTAWMLPAMLHAALEGRVFCWFERWPDLLEAVRGSSGSVVVTLPPDRLDLEGLQDLVAARSFRVEIPRLREVDFQAAPLSFLTARSLEVLTRVVAKQRRYRDQPVRQSAWIDTGASTGHATDPDVTFLGQAQASAAHLELLDRPDLLFIAGHSREDLIHLGQDAICGASLDQHPAGSERRLPACEHDGRCVKPGGVLPVTSLTARGLFVHGCNLMRLGGKGSFEPEFTLAFTALEGAANVVVASRRTRFGNAFELILMYQLLRSGHSVGEAVRLVNNTLPMSGPETPDYLVLGDGEWRLWPGPESPGERIALQRLDDGWLAICRQVDTPVLEIVLPELPGELTLESAGAAPVRQDLHYAVAPEADGSCRVLVFGWSRVVEPELRLRIGRRSPAGDVEAAIARAQRNQAYGRLYRSYLPRYDNQEKELRSLAVNLARRLSESRYLIRAASEARARAAEVEDQIARLDRGIADFVLDRIARSAFVWLDQYMEVDGSFVVAEHLPAVARCHYCDSLVLRKVVRHRYQPELAREFALCQTCGNVWDVPLGGVEPVFEGSAQLQREEVNPQQVRVRNPFGHRLRGCLGFRFYQAQRFGVEVSPPVTEVVLEPGEETIVPFEIRLPRAVPAHVEFLRGCMVANLEVSIFQRNAWVVPSSRSGGRQE